MNTSIFETMYDFEAEVDKLLDQASYKLSIEDYQRFLDNIITSVIYHRYRSSRQS